MQQNQTVKQSLYLFIYYKLLILYLLDLQFPNIFSFLLSNCFVVKLEHGILRLLKHPSIIKLHEVIETPTDICVVMEYASKELFDYVIERGRLEEDEGRNIFRQVRHFESLTKNSTNCKEKLLN